MLGSDTVPGLGLATIHAPLVKAALTPVEATLATKEASEVAAVEDHAKVQLISRLTKMTHSP